MGRIKGWRVILLSIVVAIFIIETVLLGSTLLQPEKVRPPLVSLEPITVASLPEKEVVWETEEVVPNTSEENSGYIFNMKPIIYPVYNELRDMQYFWVDFGAYEDQDNIVIVQKSLQELGLYTTVHLLDDGNKHLMIGPFLSYQSAEKGRDRFLLKNMAP